MNTAPAFQRESTKKVCVQDLVEAEYVHENDQKPNYLVLKNQEKIQRINLLAIIVSIEKIGTISSFLLDDGTGKITARFFEENEKNKNLAIGDTVLIIGKVRKYNQETYLSPEIAKKINPLWIRIRKEELGLNNYPKNQTKPNIKNIPEEEEKETSLLPTQKIAQLIKEMDKGEGVIVEDLIEKSQLKNIEVLLKKMIEKGDLFQNLPGKVKIL